jgi:hypothetical protein
MRFSPKNIVKATLVVAALVAAWVGVEDVLLRLARSEVTPLDARTLGKRSSKEPVWARVTGFVTPITPCDAYTDGGLYNGTYLVLTLPEDTTTVTAVLVTNDPREAQAVASGGVVRGVEGLVSPPSAEARDFLDIYFGRTGLRAARGLSVIDRSEEPLALADVTGFLVIVAILAGAAYGIAKLVEILLARRESFPVLFPEDLCPAASEEAEAALPEAVEVRVRHMLHDVWDKAEAQAV